MIEQIKHIKNFALQDNSALSVKQLGEAIARMCDDAIREAVEHSVQSDGAWICDRCGNNATSMYCSHCNLPIPPRK